MSSGTKAALWLVGVVVVVMLLEFTPRVGGAVLLLLVTFLALTVMQKGVV